MTARKQKECKITARRYHMWQSQWLMQFLLLINNFWATVCKTVRPMLSDRCLSLCLSVCPVLSVLSVTLVYCGQTVGWIKMKLGTQAGLGPGHNVLDGDPDPLPLKGHSPIPISAHDCCGQMARWIKMPLCRKAGLDPSDIVLDGKPAPLPKKGAKPPIFGPCLLWPNGRPSQLLLNTCCH